MSRIFLIILSCILLLSGCAATTTIETNEDTTLMTIKAGEEAPAQSFGSIDDGFCLTYPTGFELTKSTENYYEFADTEQDLTISLTIEENTFGNIAAEDYPAAMELEMYSKMLSDNSFERDIYTKDEESSYSIYTLTDEYIYCVEYNYQGGTGQDAIINQLDFEAYGEFSGSDNTDNLMSYAQVYLEDLMGIDTGHTLVYEGSRTINSCEMTVFQTYKNDDLICLIAVNNEGLCYVDYSATGKNFVNIELLLYDTTENTTDRLLYYATYYYEKLYGSASADITLHKADHYYNRQHLTVYAVSIEDEVVCHIAVTDDGVGYVDYSGNCKNFDRIEY